MLNFKKISLEDKPWIDKLLKEGDSRSCDYNFTNLYIWCGIYRAQVTEFGGRLITKYDGIAPYYSFPVGSGELKPVLEAMMEDAAQHGSKFRLRGITEQWLGDIERLYPGEYELTAETHEFDYVYETEKLATLAGKKLHSKRNHIHRFEEQHDWSFEPFTPAHVPECEEMNRKWLIQNMEEKQQNYTLEANALSRMFSHFEQLQLEGGVLRSGGEVIAYTIGEPLSSDTYVTHFEKAFSHIQGAYAMINREFAKLIAERHPEIKYINREDDMGIESLARAKRSYYPALMVEKYTASWR